MRLGFAEAKELSFEIYLNNVIALGDIKSNTIKINMFRRHIKELLYVLYEGRIR